MSLKSILSSPTTVTLIVSETSLYLAVIVACPTLLAVTTPLLTEATELSYELHITSSNVAPSLK